MSTNLPYYEVEGRQYPRVTSILSILRDPDLEVWAEKVGPVAAKRKATHAAKVGTTLDRMIKQQVAGEKVTWPRPASAEVRQGWKAWEEYRRLHEVDYQIGKPLVSPLYGYGGEPDLYKEEEIVDIKATTRLREKHWIQLHAYAPLLFPAWKPHRQWSDVMLKLIRLDTFLGTYEVKMRRWDRQIWETFLKLKDVYATWYQPQEDAHVSRQ